MTDTENTTDAAQEATQATQEPQDTPEAPEDAVDTPPEPQDDDSDDGHPAAEAKRYRLRLREAEAQRDDLAARLETMQKAEVERLAGHLTQPSAIWAAGVKVADVLDDDGNVDPERVGPAITAAAEALGLAHRPRAPRPHPAQRGEDAAPGARGDDMAAVIAGKR